MNAPRTATKRLIFSLGWLTTGCVFLLLVACGGGGGGSSSSGSGGGGGGGGGGTTIASISVAPTSASIVVGATQQFTATAKDSSGNTISGVSFTWASSTSGVASISGNGLVTGVAPGTSNITASASGVTSNAAVVTVTAAPPAKLAVTTTSLGNATVGAAYSAILQASGGTQPYTWSISSGSLPSWASLNASTGTISGTPTATGTTTFTVQVTDSESPAAKATAQLSITVVNSGGAGLLNGQYAFLVSGYDSAVAGSLTLNGSGQITGGSEDVQAPGANLFGAGLSITSGTYTVGSDNRGTLTYTDSNGNTFTFAFALGVVKNGVATQGQMIEFDSNPLEMSGSLALQTPAAFSVSALSGAYAMGLPGWDTTPSPQVTVGSFTVGGGAITSGLLDVNDNGTVQSAVAFTGSIGSISSNGRGAFSFVLPSGTVTGTFYVVSAGQWFVIVVSNTDPVVVSGQVLQQTGGPFSASSLSGAAIFANQSEDGVPAPNALLGSLTFGSGGAVSFLVDQNDNGTLTLSQTGTGTYSVTSAANGRFTLTPQGAHTLVGYLVAPNEAFTTESDAVTPDFGTLVPQAAGPFNNASLQGTYYVGTIPNLSKGAPGNPPPALNVYSGFETFDGTGGLSAILDVNSSGVPASGVTGTDTYSVASNGRVTTTSGSYVLYFASPTLVYALQTSQGQPASPNPGILIIQK